MIQDHRMAFGGLIMLESAPYPIGNLQVTAPQL